VTWEAFFKVHDGLPREGPGLPENVAWAVDLAGCPAEARILDAGCGPGADTEALARLRPRAAITAVDSHPGFTAAVRKRVPSERVTVVTGDMAAAEGPFDLIWCAGALYLLGLEAGLASMRDKLAPGGVLAFSEPCYFSDAPSPAASAFWDGYRTRGQADLLTAVAQGGFEVLGAKPLPDAAWTAYYDPLVARAARLRDHADDALLAAIEDAEAEYAAWRGVRRETGYMLVVARRA
jgi:trans-aconitate methyltransferase